MQLQLMWRLAGMAFMLSSEAAAGLFLGWLLDQWLQTPGRWIMIGGITGIVVGLTTFLRAAFRINKHMSKNKLDSPSSSSPENHDHKPS